MAKKAQKTNWLTIADVGHFDKLRSQLQKLSGDIESLSKKNPDHPINKFKLQFINEKIQNANQFLQTPYKPIENFDIFDEISLPSNSDVVMVLSQYIECLELWRSAHVMRVRDSFGGYSWEWKIENDSIPADPPTTTIKYSEEDFS